MRSGVESVRLKTQHLRKNKILLFLRLKLQGINQQHRLIGRQQISKTPLGDNADIELFNTIFQWQMMGTRVIINHIAINLSGAPELLKPPTPFHFNPSMVPD